MKQPGAADHHDPHAVQRFASAAALSALAAGRPFRFVAAGLSMVPSLWPRDVLTIAPLQSDPRPGTIVLAVGAGDGDAWFVHRVTGIDRRRGVATLRGDAQRFSHEVPLAALAGGLVSVERFGIQVPLESRAGVVLERLARALRPAGPTLAGAIRWLGAHR